MYVWQASLSNHFVQIVSNTDIDAEGCRELAMEALVSLAENAAAMVRKFPSFTQKIVPLCLQVC